MSKLYLLDDCGNSPCLGLDETVEIESDVDEQNAKINFADNLVQNEGFEYSYIPEYDVCKNEKHYKIVMQ